MTYYFLPLILVSQRMFVIRYFLQSQIDIAFDLIQISHKIKFPPIQLPHLHLLNLQKLTIYQPNQRSSNFLTLQFDFLANQMINFNLQRLQTAISSIQS